MKNYVNPLVREKLKSLHPGKEEEKLVREYYKKKIKLSRWRGDPKGGTGRKCTGNSRGGT